MEQQQHYLSQHIKLSSTGARFFRPEVVLDNHFLVWLIAGETKIVQAEATHVFRAGDAFLFPRHQLATVVNHPPPGGQHQAVTMLLSAEYLRDYYARHRPAARPGIPAAVRSFGRHPLLASCLASLVPYFDLPELLPEALARLKIEEAISILRTLAPEVDGALADFAEPGKIDLADFMERHYMFNLPLSKFGYLTGRSLSTFKRDFNRAFRQPPQQWLTRKRLELAHYQVAEQQRKPTDIYFEVGFENLSHFSTAFKKHFGYTLRELAERPRAIQ
jgi:AraC-like DNA-binding protein